MKVLPTGDSNLNQDVEIVSLQGGSRHLVYKSTIQRVKST
jgi:hypothetical protein